MEKNIAMAKSKKWFIPFVLALMLGISGCAYQGGDLNPFERRLSWYSYINGDDIRKSCQPGTPNSYRLVYNGNYTEQVRTYDLRGTELSISVILPADLSVLFVKEKANLLDPWRDKKSKTILREADVALLDDALKSDGLYLNDEAEREMASDRFYWMVTACKDGEVSFRAFLWPDEKIENLAFANLLRGWDMTDVPINPPRDVIDPMSEFTDPRKIVRFNNRVGANGLLYHR